MCGFLYAPFRRGSIRGIRQGDQALARRIEREAEIHPSPRSLDAGAKFNILAGRLDRGIEGLEQAAQAAPNDAEIENDLAAALMERAEARREP
ncbi:MAG TPA: hypothetical protein VGE98_15700, partial [Thermoanaerobaculia bacterium]